MIFQDPMMTLNPVLTIGTQMVETILAHRGSAGRGPRDRPETAPEGPSRPGKAARQYPHEFSGGMRQRIVIAIALLTNAGLIIADEPTTALDVTIQAGSWNCSRTVQHENMGLILITHDLGVVSQVTQRSRSCTPAASSRQGTTGSIVSHSAAPLH
jgi:peptide/nickel transport system ATP-binding protein